MAAVILEPRKRKSVTTATISFLFAIITNKASGGDGTGCHDLSFLNVEF